MGVHVRLLYGVGVLVCLVANPAFAHHEAIFGPQSSAVLSAGRFASAQVFTRETGPDGGRRRQTTTVFSAGMQPFKRPLSVAVVVPVSFIGVRRLPAEGRASKTFSSAPDTAWNPSDSRALLGLDESYFMGVGGVEVPTGTIDHEFGKGAVGAIAAGLMSVERRPFSVIGYGYYHHTGDYNGMRESGNVFIGTGGA